MTALKANLDYKQLIDLIAENPSAEKLPVLVKALQAKTQSCEKIAKT
jgi:hypothetical protein